MPGLMRGLAILQAFTPERREMTLSEIAEALKVSRSAAFRAVYTLAQTGFLLHDPARQVYALGPSVMRLGYGVMASREIVGVALPELERLRNDTDWSAHLGVRDGRRVLYLLRVPSHMGLGSIVHVGSRLPAAATAMGRVLLADLDQEALVALYRDASFDRAPGRSPRSMAALLAQWKEDRQTGLVEQRGQFEAGVVGVAAPVRDMTGQTIAAINLTSTAPAAPDPVRRAVQIAADRIAAQLGARGG